MVTPRAARFTVAGLMLVACAVHFACLGQYGWFRDELYYLACGAHPALGYVDHPPLIGWVAWFVVHVFGRSFVAVRIIPVLAGAATIALTARLAEKLGARGAGVILAALASWLAPTFLFLSHHLSMNVFEVLIWSAATLIAIDLDRESSLRRWALLGAVVGLGLLNKHSMLFWAAAVGCGAMATERRRLLLTRGSLVAAVVGLVVAAPHLAWQALNGYPTLEFYRNAAAHKILPMSPLDFIGAQLTLAGPGSALLWLGGLTWLLASPAAKPFRSWGIAYVALLAMLIALRGKAYYAMPFYPVLFAAGGAGAEQVSRSWRASRRNTSAWVTIALVAVAGLAVAPLALPILPAGTSIAWMRTLGLSAPQAERSNVAELPQPLADMFGWPELVNTVGGVYAGLPIEERARVQIIAMNYGEAAAIDWLGPVLGLPPALCPHNAYFRWGTPADRGAPVIVVGLASERRALLESYFDKVEARATTHCEYCMPYERNLPVFVCRGWKVPPERAWAEVRKYL